MQIKFLVPIFTLSQAWPVLETGDLTTEIPTTFEMETPKSTSFLLQRLQSKFEEFSNENLNFEDQNNGDNDENLTERAASMARSLMLTRLVSLLELDGYGCWCNFDDPLLKKPGYGEPVDEFDQFCQVLHQGYECAMLDFELSQTDANSIETCIPWEISYKFLHYRNDVVTECRSRNENNPCAINSCIVELNFVKNIMEKYKSKIMPDAEFKHKNGFDRDLICHGKIAKVEYFNLAESPKLSETDQELINSPEFLKLVKEESKSPADTQQMMANLRSLQSGFEDLDPNFIQPGDGFLENLPNQPNFSSMTELVETLPPNLQTKFFSHTKPGSNEILNKSCCGNYPHRKPYHTGNLATGEIRMCCGDKTFNPLKLKCCRGILDPFNFYVRKRCPDETDVAYVL